MNRGFSKVLLIVGLAMMLFLVVTYVIEKQNVPSLTLIAPSISASGDQVLKPGPYEVKWKAVGVDGVVVSVIKSGQTTNDAARLVVTSGPIDASTGSYIIQVPSSIPVEGSNPKYQFWIAAWIAGKSGFSVKSSPFTVD